MRRAELFRWVSPPPADPLHALVAGSAAPFHVFRQGEGYLVQASNSDLTPLIRKLESISPLTELERQAILGLPATIRVFEARQDILRDKDRPTHCCLILSGWACRFKLLHE